MRALTKGFGITGLILILFGIIALAITKLMNWYVYLHLGLGVVLIILYAVFNFETFLDRLKERSTTEGSKVFVYSGIVILIIVVLNVISFRKSTRWDFTATSIHSLEEQSLGVLKKLTAPLEVTGFFHAKNQLRERFKELMEIYAYNSDKLTFTIVDPDKQPGIANKYTARDGDIRFVYGPEGKLIAKYDEKVLRQALQFPVERITYFGASLQDPGYEKIKALLAKEEFVDKEYDLRIFKSDAPLPPEYDVDPKPGNLYITYVRQDNVVQEVSEEIFTNAIIKISREDNPVVYFASAHGERSIDDEEQGGISILKSAIINEGYEVKSLQRSLLQGVPDDADMLVIAGPRSPYTKEEADSVDRFLEGGGKVALLLDPNISNPKLNPVVSILDTGLEDLTEKWGVTLGKDIVLERHLQLLRGQTIDPYIISQNYGSHAITQPLSNRATFFQLVRSVVKSKQANPDLTVTELISSSAGKGNSWAERDINTLINKQNAEPDDQDLNGPVSIAAVAERTKRPAGKAAVESKLVVFGDADFVANRYIRQEEFNYDLFLNTLNWMWGKQEQISIRPKQLRSSKLLLTPKQTNIIFYAAVLTIPELVLIAGLFIYWRRKSR